MIFHRIKTEIVSHLSYFIGSDNEAIVVDPMRDCETYMDLAMREGVNIRYVFETHRNEDYVIGSLELSSLSRAKIYHGPWPEYKYGKVVEDGQEFEFGKLKATAIHTPGHTAGCVSYAITDLDSGEEPVLVCTGDTLFVNDVGRTDFGGEHRSAWSEDLYNSIFNKLLPMGDHVVLCPAHGSGSVCGGGIAEREVSTLGLERLMNPILQMSREKFINFKVKEHHEYAPYFRMMEKLNVEGAPFVGIGPKPPALKPTEFKEKIKEEAIIVDIRPPPSFGAGHIKGSYNLVLKRLGLAGWVLPYDKPLLLLLGNQGQLDTVARSLVRIGYDNIEGYLVPSIVSWYKAALPLERLDMLTAIEFKDRMDEGEDWTVLDVRSTEEWLEGHIDGSINVYVGLLKDRLEEVPEKGKIAVVCKTGTRSSFASSILLRAGRGNITNVLGGMDAWKKASYDLVK
ncbi:MAG: MBL fold metallo-hydrolase [Chloroflexi bacterium]|nr:MBL fold metallo-hydrolase [Chloroflexota bacterium]